MKGKHEKCDYDVVCFSVCWRRDLRGQEPSVKSMAPSVVKTVPELES